LKENLMGKVILGLTISLDGFINDENGSVESLYPDLAGLRYTDPLKESIKNTGAVVMGRRAFAMGGLDAYDEDYEYQVPIFVLTRNNPKQQPRPTKNLTFTYVLDGIESAILQAKAIAGSKDVTIIGGASTARQALAAGLVDEIHLDIMPLLLGRGLRLFENIDGRPIRLERISILEAPVRTHLKFRVLKEK
jgi:dihydrofolate reductase